MYDSEIVEYINRNKMEETTGKVFARLHQMKSILCKTIKSKYCLTISSNIVCVLFLETPQFCGGITHRNGSYCSPRSYYNNFDKFSEPIVTSLLSVSIGITKA
jgi:hypothetical protein